MAIVRKLPRGWKRYRNLVGIKFSHLTVESDLGIEGGARQWKTRCDCGKIRKVRTDMLLTGRAWSCGCKNTWGAGSNITHGHSLTGRKTPEYIAWLNMRKRCTDKRARCYVNYGGRGIAVCDRWRDSFENFLEDMGARPSPSHSLDRIDVNGNYRPENCRWATVDEQNANRRSTVMATFRGETRSIIEWSQILGINRKTIYYRLTNGRQVDGSANE